MCDRHRKPEPNYQKLVDPPYVPYGTILGDPKPDKNEKQQKIKPECVQIVICSPKECCSDDKSKELEDKK